MMRPGFSYVKVKSGHTPEFGSGLSSGCPIRRAGNPSAELFAEPISLARARAAQSWC